MAINYPTYPTYVARPFPEPIEMEVIKTALVANPAQSQASTISPAAPAANNSTTA